MNPIQGALCRLTINASGVKTRPGVVTYGSQVFALGHPGGSNHNVLSLGQTFNGELEEQEDLQGLFRGLDNLSRKIGRFIPDKFFAPVQEAIRVEVEDGDRKIEIKAQEREPGEMELMHITNHIEKGNSGGLLSDPSGNLVGVTVAGGPRGLIPVQLLARKYQPQKAYAVSVPALMNFIRQELPELNLEQLMVGEEVNTPQLIRESGVD